MTPTRVEKKTDRERHQEALVNRDSILTDLLRYIGKNEQLKSELILHGGGALHFIYSSPRYSSDLDFVSPNLRAKRQEIILNLTDMDEICRSSNHKIIERYTPFLKQPKRQPKEPNHVRVSYSQNMPDTPTATIEVDEQTAQDYAPAKGKFHPVLVESPGEIYADKILATLGRMQRGGSIGGNSYREGSLKGTDLFDLDYIVNNLGGVPSEEMTFNKRDSYQGQGWTRDNFEKVLRFISDKKNHKEMIDSIKSTLMLDVYYAMENKFGSEFFDKTASHFETLMPQEPTLIFP